MDQGIAVDALDRGSDPKGAIIGDVEKPGAGENEKRPQALAAARVA